MTDDWRTSIVEPGTFHARRQSVDYDLLAEVPKETREAIFRAICPLCKLGASESSVSTSSGWDRHHHVDGEKRMCRAASLREHFFNVDRSKEAAATASQLEQNQMQD